MVEVVQDIEHDEIDEIHFGVEVNDEMQVMQNDTEVIDEMPCEHQNVFQHDVMHTEVLDEINHIHHLVDVHAKLEKVVMLCTDVHENDEIINEVERDDLDEMVVVLIVDEDETEVMHDDLLVYDIEEIDEMQYFELLEIDEIEQDMII